MPVFDSTKSKIKMVALTAPGKANITWWSILSEQKELQEKVIKGMLRRLKNAVESGKIKDKVQVLQFYENGELIHKEKF